MQRKINFHLDTKDSSPFLSVLEIKPANSEEANAYPMGVRLLDSVISFNGIKSNDEERAYVFMDKFLQEQPKETQEVDKAYPFTNFSITEVKFKLPLEPKAAFEFIGGVDGFLSNVVYRAKRDDESVDIAFDAITETTDMNAYCHQSFHVNKPNPNVLPEKPLSRRIAEFLQVEATKAAKAFEELLKVNDPSLSYPIRTMLYPDTGPKEFIEKMNVSDPLYIEMLNPDVSYVSMTAKLISKLRTMLKDMVVPPKGEVLTEDQIASNQTIKQAVDNYINEFAKLCKSFWEMKIETLFAIDAPDGGKYAENYTEISLLKEAEFKINEAGLMQLVYKRSESEAELAEEDKTAYERHYAEGQENHDILEEELRAACERLGLHFLPNIDFHKGAIFDQASSVRLFNLRMHYSVDYLKSMMREMHHAHVFNAEVEGNNVAFPKAIRFMLFKNLDPRLQATELAAVAQLPRLV